MDMIDQFQMMLVCAYIQLINPILNIVLSFLLSKGGKQAWGVHLPGFPSMTAGSLYLAFYYKVQSYLQSHRGPWFKLSRFRRLET